LKVGNVFQPLYAASSNFSRMKPTKMQRGSSHNQQNMNPNVGVASTDGQVNNDVKANLDSVLEIGTDKRNSKNSNRGGKRKKIGGATSLDAQTSTANTTSVQ
jgi:hypothetical protein